MQEHVLKNVINLDNPAATAENDGFFYEEMMSHSALFTHPLPQKVAIMDQGTGILAEVVKHPAISHIAYVRSHAVGDEPACSDARVQIHNSGLATWLQQCEAATFDLMIHNPISAESTHEDYQLHRHALQSNGILMLPCPSSWLQVTTLKPLLQQLQQAGFKNWQLLNFPQPSYGLGWRSILMATPCPTFARIREKDIYNRTFTTRYYNFDIHKASLALPEFVRKELLEHLE